MESLIVCYTDASYSPQFKVAVVGWQISGASSEFQIYQNVSGSAQAEKLAIDHCNNAVGYASQIILYTDHVPSAKIRTEFPNITFNYIKGHKKKSLMKNDHDRIFSQLDKKVRRELRSYIKTLQMHN